jgi:DNA-binding NtrC family response regulator
VLVEGLLDKCVIVREDEPDLARLVEELLQDVGYTVIKVLTIDELLWAAGQYSPCVALIDGQSPTTFDLWWLGPQLAELGVPPIAFTAHVSARAEFEQNPNGFVGVISKPFDADEFIELVNTICWEEHQADRAQGSVQPLSA